MFQSVEAMLNDYGEITFIDCVSSTRPWIDLEVAASFARIFSVFEVLLCLELTRTDYDYSIIFLASESSNGCQQPTTQSANHRTHLINSVCIYAKMSTKMTTEEYKYTFIIKELTIYIWRAFKIRYNDKYDTLQGLHIKCHWTARKQWCHVGEN